MISTRRCCLIGGLEPRRHVSSHLLEYQKAKPRRRQRATGKSTKDRFATHSRLILLLAIIAFFSSIDASTRVSPNNNFEPLYLLRLSHSAKHTRRVALHPRRSSDQIHIIRRSERHLLTHQKQLFFSLFFSLPFQTKMTFLNSCVFLRKHTNKRAIYHNHWMDEINEGGSLSPFSLFISF